MKIMRDYILLLGISCSYCKPRCYENAFGLRPCLIGELRAETRKNMIDIAFEMIMRGEY